jgi:DnaJ-class molecular chaperone
MARGKGTPGHLYAMVRIEVPTVIDDDQKKLYQQLADTSNFAPHAHLSQEASK